MSVGGCGRSGENSGKRDRVPPPQVYEAPRMELLNRSDRQKDRNGQGRQVLSRFRNSEAPHEEQCTGQKQRTELRNLERTWRPWPFLSFWRSLRFSSSIRGAS